MKNMWKPVSTERPETYQIDKSFEKINDDGTKEKIRFVKYPGTSSDKVNFFHTKIKKTNMTLAEHFGKEEIREDEQQEYLWDLVFNNHEVWYIVDVENAFGIKLKPSRMNLIINTIKDILNGTKI